MTAPLPRVIVVTGAASGIGNATVLRFLAAGDHPTVVAADLAYPAGASLREQPDRMIAYGLDHSEAEAVGELMEWIRHRYGRIDVLCVVAGVAGPLSPVAEQRPDDWRTVQDANLLGAFLIARAAVPLLSEGHDPAVVFGASTAGLFGQANAGPYAAAKAGIVALARTLAVELGPVGIRVNVVCPGAVDTPMLRRRLTEADLAAAASTVPLGRIAAADDIATIFTFLASPDARHITGATIVADGGESLTRASAPVTNQPRGRNV